MPRKIKHPRTFSKGTQTGELEFESDLEIARLQEQVKLLEIQVKVLRNHNDNKLTQSNWMKEVEPLNTPKRNTPTRDTKTLVKGCSCKGKCSSQKCGCVKKNSVCTESCKCNHKICENKTANIDEENKENGGDVANTAPENKRSIEKKDSTWSLGIPEETIYDIPNSSEADVSFNPMIPKHQLPRTPPNGSNERALPQNFNVRPLQTSPPREPEEKSFIENVLNQAEVDWEQHQAILVQCTKCKRKLFPYRIQKHEACCKEQRKSKIV